MKTAVLVHGHHLGTSNWEEVVWGNPKEGIYGRIATGIREAIRFNADVIFFPTGGSEKEGLKEGEWALKIADERILEIPECSTWSADEADRWLSSRSVLELSSTTTVEEIAACAWVHAARAPPSARASAGRSDRVRSSIAAR